MSKASEIAHNVWLGPTPDSSLQCSSVGEDESPSFDILIEASDLAQASDLRTLNRIGELSYSAPQHLEFPSSGSIMPQSKSALDVDPLTEMCQWIFKLANRQITPDSSEDEQDADGDIPMKNLSLPSSRKILIHCTDGYTESTLLGLAYFMYAEGIPVHDAWLRLHCEKKRNFFAYPSDVALLASLQPRLLESSPCAMTRNPGPKLEEPAWLSRIDGSLPSRILPYMYLGNLGHANNPDLLKAMGIKKILSVGEPVNWTNSQRAAWGAKNLLFIDRVQDNGVDPLMNEFEKCLDFIGKDFPHVREMTFDGDLIQDFRKREIGWHSDSGALPRWRLSISNDLHRGSHGFASHVFSTSIVGPFRFSRSDPVYPSFIRCYSQSIRPAVSSEPVVSM